MKKAIVALLAIAVLAAAGCRRSEGDSAKKFETQNKELAQQLTMAQDSKDSLVLLMNDFIYGIEQINEQQEWLFNLQGNGDLGMQRSTVIENLTQIRNALKDKQEMLKLYSSQLNDANDQNKLLRSQVVTLQDMLSKSEARVDRLLADMAKLKADNAELTTNLETTRNELDRANVAVDSLSNETQLQGATIRQNEADRNRVYFCIGTKNELKANNILGKNNKVLQGNYNQSFFTERDMRTFKSINCGNKKAEVLSSQPSDSYRFEEDANKNKTLVITNPDKFWNASRYLVIKVG